MSYIRKSPGNVIASIGGVILVAAFAVWQFYQFVTFKSAGDVFDVQGGTLHLWLAIGATLIACVAGFFVFSVFLRYDRDDEIHITSSPASERRLAAETKDVGAVR
jgi:heme exporter protein D